MPYVERDSVSSLVVGLFNMPQPGYAEEWLADDDPDVVAFHNRPEMLYEQAMAKGLAVTFTNTAALNATYGVDNPSRATITGEQVSINMNNKFQNGTANTMLADITGLFHSINVTQFKNLATALAAYHDGLAAARDQGAPWPADSVTVNG